MDTFVKFHRCENVTFTILPVDAPGEDPFSVWLEWLDRDLCLSRYLPGTECIFSAKEIFIKPSAYYFLQWTQRCLHFNGTIYTL